MAHSPWILGPAAATAASSLLVAWLVLRPDCMVVETVTFEGRAHAGWSELRHLSDLRNGTTIWAVDLDAIERGVERHPWVEQASARRVWPDAVAVDVVERQPVAVVHLEELHYVDRHGELFLKGRLPTLDLPHITGIDSTLSSRHPQLPRLVVRDAIHLLDALENRGIADGSEVSELTFSSARGFTVYVGASRVLFDLDRTEQQLDRLEYLVSQGEVRFESGLWVDLAPSDVAIVRPLLARAGT